MKMLKKMMSWALALVLVLSAVCGGISVAHAAQADLDLKVEKTDDNKVKVSIVAKGDTTVAAIGGWLDFDKEAFTRTGKSSPKLDSTVVASNPESAHPDLMMFSGEPKIIEDEEGNATMPIPEFADGEAIIVFTFTPTDKYDETKDYNFKLIIDELRDSDGVDHPVADITKTLEGEAPAVTYTVKFLDADGNQFGDIVEVEEGKTVAKPEGTPTAPEGKRFAYWALNGQEYDFNTPVTANIELTPVFEEIPTHELTITKKVESSVDEYTGTFEFEITGGTYEGPVDNITAPTITADSVTVANPDTTGTVTVNLDNVEWPAGGVYTYTITEKKDTNDDPAWDYDDTEYTLIVTVEPNANTGELEISNVKVTKGGTTVTDPTDSTKKAFVVEFTNPYEPNTELTIEKKVEGTPTEGFGTEEFDFTITFGQAFTGTVVKTDAESNETTETWNFAEPYPFKLKDGEKIVIKGIPAGVSYTVTEAGAPYYTATATLVNGDTEVSVDPGTLGNGIEINVEKIGVGTNKVTVTNTYGINPDTGVVIHGEMIAIAILVLVAMAGSFILSRKLRRA